MPFVEINNRRILFIHIPKTGGSSIEKWLQQHGKVRFLDPYPRPITRVSPQHFPISDIARIFSSDWWSWAFTVVRNPYDRIESEYFYQRSLHKKISDFSTWVEDSLEILEDDPFYLDNHLRSQVYFLDGSVNYFKYEDGYKYIFNRLSSVIGVPPPISEIREMKGERFPITWTANTRRRFNEIYETDFRAFNYQIFEQ